MHDEYNDIPELTMEILTAYVERHRPTGGFLEAVLSNDLANAIGKADEFNFPALRSIVRWVYWKCPYIAWGTPEKYAAWIKSYDPEEGR